MLYAITFLIQRRRKKLREADHRNEEKLLRWKLEDCYIQGKIEEAVKIGRRLDEMQCQLLREVSEPHKAAV